MKLVSINIESNLHTETVLNLLREETPDVICMQEMLEEDFELYRSVFNFNGIYKSQLYIGQHHVNSHFAGKRHGLAIFSKNIINSGYEYYVGSEENVSKSYEEYFSDNKFQENRVLVWVDILDSNKNVFRFCTTHFTITKKGESTPKQFADLDLLFKALEPLGEFILCGDMNAPRGNETFTRLANKYKDNIPLEYKTSIDQNLHRVKGIMFMVDGLFTTPKYEASNVKLVDGVSDHMAIVADIEKIL